MDENLKDKTVLEKVDKLLLEYFFDLSVDGMGQRFESLSLRTALTLLSQNIIETSFHS